MVQDHSEKKMVHREIELLGSTLACIPRGFTRVVPHLHSGLSLALPAVSLKGGCCLKEGGYVSIAHRHLDPEDERN